MIPVKIELDLGVYRGLKRDAASKGVAWQSLAADLVAAGVTPMTAEEISATEDAARKADMLGKDGE